MLATSLHVKERRGLVVAPYVWRRQTQPITTSPDGAQIRAIGPGVLNLEMIERLIVSFSVVRQLSQGQNLQSQDIAPLVWGCIKLRGDQFPTPPFSPLQDPGADWLLMEASGPNRGISSLSSTGQPSTIAAQYDTNGYIRQSQGRSPNRTGVTETLWWVAGNPGGTIAQNIYVGNVTWVVLIRF